MSQRAAGIAKSALDAIVGGERADRALARALRSHRELSSLERACVAEWTLGIALWRGRLDVMAQGDRSLWLGLFLVDREKRTIEEAAHLSGCDPARLAHALATPPSADPIEKLAFERSLPRWLAQRWTALWGLDRADRLAAAMNERGPIAIRANLLRTTPDALVDALSQEGVTARRSALASTGLIVDGRPNIVALESWRGGLFEVQDEGSQLIAQAVDARPDETIVDLCAGSGGKTLALAAAMENRGRLVAVDIDPQRLVDLNVRARRAGVTCIETRAGDARDPALLADVRADAVLIDAPCSSVGTLRRGPDARWRMSIDEPMKWTPMQAALLHVGAQIVHSGGRFVYATCSIDPAENEEVSATVGASDGVLHADRTVYPDVQGCDGFYWAVFRRVRTS